MLDGHCQLFKSASFQSLGVSKKPLESAVTKPSEL